MGAQSSQVRQRRLTCPKGRRTAARASANSPAVLAKEGGQRGTEAIFPACSVSPQGRCSPLSLTAATHNETVAVNGPAPMA